MRRITIPDGTERICSYWFWGSEVESFTVPASVSEIGVDAFCGCRKLKKLVFKTASKMGIRAKKSIGAKTASSASRLKVIRAGAFHGCESLRNVKLPEGLEEIGPHAFSQSGLESVATPQSVRRIYQGAFH